MMYNCMYVVNVRELLAVYLARTGLCSFSSWQTRVSQVTKAGRQIKLYAVSIAYK